MLTKLKSLWLVTGLLLSIGAWAQTRTVEGKISKNNGEGISAASIKVKGSNAGAAADGAGNFKLTNVPSATFTITISALGFSPKDVVVPAGETMINITLDDNSNDIGEVVVTALGINRQKKSLGYVTQQVSGADLSTARETNVANALTGKVAGLVITRGTSGPGASTRLQLRGDRALQGYNQPLYVIDGVPVDNTIRGATGEFNGSDGGDAIGNLSPDDIESMNVLKGANAAALYGARAANGVIIITTKKGRTQKGIGIAYSFNYSIEDPTYSLKKQDQYGQGDNGVYGATSVNSWGPRITGQSVNNWLGESYSLAAQDHVGSFFQTGSTLNNAISLTTGNDKAQFRFAYNNESAKGIVPGNKFTRHSFMVRSNFQINKQFSIDAKINYINQLVENRPAGGEEATNPYSDLIRMPNTVRNSDLQRYNIPESGRPRNNFFTKDGSIINNPYWIINNFLPLEERNRFLSAVTLKYQLMDNLSAQARVGLDKFVDNNERKVNPGSPTQLVGGNSLSGDFSANNLNSTELNADFLLTYTKDLNNDFSLAASLGTAIYNRKTIFESQSAGGLDIPYLFKPSNGRNVQTDRAVSETEIQSIYATASLSYKNYLFLDITGRNDWSSTLPADNRSFFYPSFSLSAVLSDMTKLPEFFTFAKLRASYAFVGSGAEGPYTFSQNLNSAQGVSGIILANSSTLALKDLKPQQTRSLEIGAEMRFLKDRLGLDVTYYKTNSLNQILSLPLPLSSLFQNKIINAGNIENSGIELMLNATIVKTKDLQWDLGVNYAVNNNKLIELTPGLDSTLISSNRAADLFAKVGDPLGNLYVRAFQRNAAGRIEVGANGIPLFRPGRPLKVGNYNPDFTAGITNTIRYKGLSLSFLIDAKVGGKIVSHTQAVLAGAGLTEETVVGRENTYVVDGDLVGGGKNTTPITAQAYWNAVGGRGGPVGEAFTYSATNVRLRQVTLSYRFPKSMFTNSFFTGIDVSLFGRNLFFLSKDAPFDPEASLNNGLGGQGIDFYGMPTTRSMGINVNISF
jgi:TonB-linked SusC/RagA family outer membrane protein